MWTMSLALAMLALSASEPAKRPANWAAVGSLMLAIEKDFDAQVRKQGAATSGPLSAPGSGVGGDGLQEHISLLGRGHGLVKRAMKSRSKVQFSSHFSTSNLYIA